MIHAHNSPESGLAAIALKIHKYVERAGEATASRLKSGVRALRKMGAEQIRQLMQTLANVGFGAIRGAGAEMVYATAPPTSSPPTNPPPIDTIDSLMTDLSIAEVQPEPIVPVTVDTIDELTKLTNQSVRLDAAQPHNSEPPTAAQPPSASLQCGAQAAQAHLPEPPTVAQAPLAPLQRGTRIEVWFEKAWVIATYLRPLHRSIFSHRTKQLDEGHQVALAVDPAQMPSAWQIPSAYRVAEADIRRLQPAH